MVIDLWHVSVKIGTPVFILCAGIRQLLGKSRDGRETFIAVELSMFCKSFVKFDLVTSEIFRCVCMGWVGARRHKCALR